MGTGGPCAVKTPTFSFIRLLSFSPFGLGWHWPIFPARLRASIFGSAQLNFCVRNGYRWTLCVKNTNQLGAGTNFRFCSCYPLILPRQWSRNIYRTFVLVHLRGLEPRTHWLRVSCSTNWARGAYGMLFPLCLTEVRPIRFGTSKISVFGVKIIWNICIFRQNFALNTNIFACSKLLCT